MTKQVSIGNSTRGYDYADVITTAHGKIKLSGEIAGNKKLVARALANVNRGINTVVTNGGDELLISIR